MNWYRAKTILIVFFVCMNVFLLVNLIYSANKANILTPEIISSTVEILARNNIEINPEIIPSKTVAVDSVEMKNVFVNKESFAKTFCGADAVMSENDVYSGTNGRLTFSGDRFTYTPVSLFNGNEGRNIRESAEILLAGFGINVSLENCTEYNENGNTVLKFENSVNKYKIFDSYIKLIVNSSGQILSIDGVWFEKVADSGDDISLKNVTGVLIDFILQPERPEGKNVIEKLELGYTASGDNIYHETTVLIPVWRITLSDGNVYCIDTRE